MSDFYSIEENELGKGVEDDRLEVEEVPRPLVADEGTEEYERVARIKAKYARLCEDGLTDKVTAECARLAKTKT